MQISVQQPCGEPAPADVEAIAQALSAPFEAHEVKFKPAVVSGHRALALAYVDARVVQDRLDEVLGVMGWQDSYRVLPDGSVMCRLRLKIGAQWITKVDVGGQSEQPDGGDRTKAAFSDALKRAAVKFGVGRYLYRLPQLWCDYDAHKRQFVRPPQVVGGGRCMVGGGKQPSSPPTTKPSTIHHPPSTTMPADGAALLRRLTDYDGRLASQGVCRPGDLLRHVVEAGVKAGHAADLATWTGPAIRLAVEETRTFEASRKPRPAAQKEVA